MENKYLDLDGLKTLTDCVKDLFPVYVKNIEIPVSLWIGGEIKLKCSAIKKDSIVNIYFSEDSREYTTVLNFEYRQEDGFVAISTNDIVTSDITIDIIEIVNPKDYNIMEEGK